MWLPDVEMPANKMNANGSLLTVASQVVHSFALHLCFCNMIDFVGSWNCACCEAHALFLQCSCSLSVTCPQQVGGRIRRHMMQMSYRGHELNVFHGLPR